VTKNDVECKIVPFAFIVILLEVILHVDVLVMLSLHVDVRSTESVEGNIILMKLPAIN
jgi:hypothetical protein